MQRLEEKVIEIMDEALMQVSAIGEQVEEAENQGGHNIDYRGTLQAAVKWADDALNKVQKLKDKRK